MQDQPGSVIDALARALVHTGVVDAATRDPMSEANSLIAEIASQHGIYGQESYAAPLFCLLPGLQDVAPDASQWVAVHPDSPLLDPLRRPDWDSLTPDEKVQARLDGTEYREPTLEERVAAVEARLAALESRPSPYDVIGDQMSPGR